MKRNFVVTAAGRVVGVAAQAFNFALLARALGVTEFGTVSIVLAAAAVVFGVSDLGLNTLVLRLNSAPDRRRFYGSALTTRFVGIVCVAGVSLCVAVATSGDAGLVVAASIFAAGEALGQFSFLSRQSESRATRASVELIGRRLLGLVPFVAWGAVPMAGLWSLLLSGVAGVVLFIGVVSRRSGRPHSARYLVRRYGAQIVTSLGPQVQQLDVLAVGSGGGLDLAGFYGAGARLMQPVNLAVTTMTQVLVPGLAAEDDALQRLRLFQRARKVVVAFACGAAVTAIGSPWITVTVFGSDFAAASPIVAGALIAAGVSAISQIHLSWFYAGRVPATIALGMIGAAILRVLLAGLAARVFGPTVLGVVLVASECIIAAVVILAWRADTRGIRQ